MKTGSRSQRNANASPRLLTGSGAGPVVGQLGGEPALPVDVAWPWWEGKGPLAFIASVDCSALPDLDGDSLLPRAGSLLFFYFDGQVDDGENVIGYWDPDSARGARVVFVPPGAPVRSRAAPAPIEAYPLVPLHAEPVATAPSVDHPVLYGAFGALFDEETGRVHPVVNSDFRRALFDLCGAGHQLGGYAYPIQGEVEYEVAQAVLGGNVKWEDPALRDEAVKWVLLAQFDSDDAANMMWGDCGMLYWLIRPEDLAARRFDRATFTWQCC
ncbi:YwqG family protein [Micromonospora sp. NPDC007271]|uniref:YwqG family protein n=1 Tax=Micromonospora sp. NPDC007271 TaxID=3154587 RepID=UPI003405FADA